MIDAPSFRGAFVTRYAELTRAQAAAVLVIVVGATVWLLAAALEPAPARGSLSVARDANQGGGDAALYQAIVARVRGGDGYYDAVGVELRKRHYAVRPAFNWRQPTYAWVLSRLPSPLFGTAILGLVGAVVVILSHQWMRQAHLERRALVVAGLMAVTMAGCLAKNFVFMQESWAGSFIALSICLFALDRWRAAVVAGLIALAFRELALIPCGVGVCLALYHHRWKELASWLAGLATYAALMALHLVEVSRHFQPHDRTSSWLAFGGASFLLSTCQWSGALVILPRWAIALVLPLTVLGLAGWRDQGATRATFVVAGYLLAFSFVGNAFNDYWGAIYAPLLSFGIAVAPDCIRDLFRALRGAHVTPRSAAKV